MNARYYIVERDGDIPSKATIEEALREIELKLCTNPNINHYSIIKGEIIPVNTKVVVSPLFEELTKVD